MRGKVETELDSSGEPEIEPPYGISVIRLPDLTRFGTEKNRH